MRSNVKHRVGRLLAVTAVALLLGAAAPAVAWGQATLRLEADPSTPGNGHQQVNEPVFELAVLNRENGNGDTTAYRVQLLVSVADPSLLAGVTIELDGTSTTIEPADLEEGTPVFACSGHPVPPHEVYPAWFTGIDLGDILTDEQVDMTVTVTGSDGLSVHFEAIGEGLRQQGGSTVCTDVYAPPGHHVTALLGSGSPPAGECAADLDKTADVDAVDIGDQVVFTLVAVASDDCDLTSVVITDTIPIIVDDSGNEYPAFTVRDVDPDPAILTDTEIVWNLGTLPMGSSFTATVTVVFDEELADGHEVVNAACLTAAELDHPACDSAVIAVGDVTRPEPIGGPGFWCRQVRAALEGSHNAQFSLEELGGWLDEINDGSLVFYELYDTSTLESARTLLCRPNTLRTAAERLARHHLTLWLNLVSARVDPELTLGELCPGDEPPPEGTDLGWTVGYVRDQAEAAILSGEDDATLLFWMAVEDFINNASAPEECATSLRRSAGLRRLMP
jgi:hypothetical protein